MALGTPTPGMMGHKPCEPRPGASLYASAPYAGGDSGSGGVDESLSIADALNSCSSRVEDLEQALIEFTNDCANEELEDNHMIGGVEFDRGDSMSDSAQLLRASTATPLHSIQTTSIVDMASKLAQGVQKIAQKVGFGG